MKNKENVNMYMYIHFLIIIFDISRIITKYIIK